jgi:hypothetical protein
MKKETWVLLSLTSVLLVFCAVRAVRSPAASAGAQSGTPNAMYRVWEPSTAVCAEHAQPDENETGAGANNINTAHELHLRRLETVREAQRMKQQEAANELQWRQQEVTRPLS